MTTRSNPNLVPSQLRIAADIWKDISVSREPADRWLGNFFHHNRKKFGSHDRRFLSETIYSCFRHKLFLEFWAEHLGHAKDPAYFVYLAAVREGFVSEISDQRFRVGDLPRSKQPANPEEYLSLRYSFPLWIVARWLKRFGAKECEALLASQIERPPLSVRTNTVKCSREQLLEKFQKMGFQVVPTTRATAGIIFEERQNLFDSEEFREGLFEIQDEASQLVCEAVNPNPKDVLWDVCAGGGGKSLALAALMKNQGRVIATDIRGHKLEELRKRAKRAGLYNIFPAEIKRMGDIGALKKGADKILVDAPCSGTGTFRRNPDAKWKLEEMSLNKFHEDQVVIVESALPHLKTGGRIFYATCSIEPEENEEVVREIMSRHSNLRLVPLGGANGDYLRFYPHRDNTDGFFLACAEKV